MRVRLVREVTPAECQWLDAPLPEGSVFYLCLKPTYGAVTDNGFALTCDPAGGYPFFEVPSDAVVEVPA